MANLEKLLILLIQIICFCMKYPYSINSLSYECDNFRMDFHIGQSTPAIRTFSSACPNPNPIINIIEFRSHVSPVYVPAHILPPNTILNQCTMLCTESTWQIHGLGMWGLWFASTSFALHRETGHPMHRMYLLFRLITPCSLFKVAIALVNHPHI